MSRELIFKLALLISLITGLFAYVQPTFAFDGEGITSIRKVSESFNGCSWVVVVEGSVLIDPNTEWSWIDSNGNTWTEAEWVHMGAHEKRSEAFTFDRKANGNSVTISFKAFGKDHKLIGNSPLTMDIPQNPICLPTATATASPTPAKETPDASPTPPTGTITPTTSIVPTPGNQPRLTPTMTTITAVATPGGNYGHSDWDFREGAKCDPTGADQAGYNPIVHSMYTFTVTHLSNFPLRYLSDGAKNVVKGDTITVSFADAQWYDNGLGIRITGIGLHDDGSTVERSREPAWIIPDPNTAEGAAWYKKQGCWFTGSVPTVTPIATPTPLQACAWTPEWVSRIEAKIGKNNVRAQASNGKIVKIFVLKDSKWSEQPICSLPRTGGSSQAETNWSLLIVRIFAIAALICLIVWISRKVRFA